MCEIMTSSMRDKECYRKLKQRNMCLRKYMQNCIPLPSAKHALVEIGALLFHIHLIVTNVTINSWR